MRLTPGTRLGSYEILSFLSSGGMGEVYRGRDIRLNRSVAIKVLPSEFSSNPDRLRRFENEARAASALNHPNIITIHDVGVVDSRYYIAMEFVEGKTFRELLVAGSLDLRKALLFALQIAEGLSKAHDGGIVHRDLKPENIMINKDGYVKILDFGLAKLTLPVEEEETNAPTAVRTKNGIIMGTVGYMSPEQASGKEIDFTSDQFSFGAIFHEMISGQRAFERKTVVDTLAAILNEQPQPAINKLPAPVPVRWILERCLAKSPDARYASTRDLARDLRNIQEHLSDFSSEHEKRFDVSGKSRSAMIWKTLAIASIVALAAVALYLFHWSNRVNPSLSSYQRISYRRGPIHSARLTSDAQTIIYSASFEGRLQDLYLARTKGVESRALGIPNVQLLSVSHSGEMLVLSLDKKNTLGRVAPTGGSLRELEENVLSADWTPEGDAIALARFSDGMSHLEFPARKPIYKTARRLDMLRISPDGNRVAFVEAAWGGSNGLVKIIDTNGKLLSSSSELLPNGISWAPEGNEIWFATFVDRAFELQALSVSGKQRSVTRFPMSLALCDISRDGGLLLNINNARLSLVAGSSGKERDLSWLDESEISDFSPDGKRLLIFERGEGSDAPYGSIYVRGIDGSPAIKLAAGEARSFSPDQRWVLGSYGLSSVMLVPTGAGSVRNFEYQNIGQIWDARFLPDGKEIVLSGMDKNGKAQIVIQDLNGKKLKSMNLPNAFPIADRLPAISPDCESIVSRNASGKFNICSLQNGKCLPLTGTESGEIPFQWSKDGKSVFVFDPDKLPIKIYKLNVANGERKLHIEITPSDPAGINRVVAIRISPDEKSYAYSYERSLSTLYFVRGVH